jgi:hypothetical protein
LRIFDFNNVDQDGLVQERPEGVSPEEWEKQRQEALRTARIGRKKMFKISSEWEQKEEEEKRMME